MEWQNLYPRREIMVLGANEQANQTIANRTSAVSGRGLKARSENERRLEAQAIVNLIA
jgi:hypothetical protein